MFAAMRFADATLHLIDQRVLPREERWLACTDVETVADAIEQMAVRGAPAIGCAAAYGLALGMSRLVGASARDITWSALQAPFEAASGRLARTRPTAVNLFYALGAMGKVAAGFAPQLSGREAAHALTACADLLFEDDLATCQAIGRAGASMAEGRAKPLRILTHCNTGSLATAGFGTALGVVRALHERGLVEMVYVDETRPWLQGARLTAFELRAEGIPYRVIADGAAAYVMQQGKVDWAIVGADRIAANGDTANKIGTLSVAVAAKHHGVPFFVAAPLATFDAKIMTGAQIPVEERGADELRQLYGSPLTPADAAVYNPSFDVTPSALIAGIVTECGVLRAPYGDAIAKALG
jgi:methylthioribose-1-phosphate isomerase